MDNRDRDSEWWDGDLKQALALPASVQIVGRSVSVGDFDDEEHSLPPALTRASPKRKTEYLAGRRCAAEALRAAGCSDASPPGMDQDRLPIWPSGWLGCITHSNGRAIAAASSGAHSRLLGIDVEKLIDPVLVDGIGALVTLEGELAMLTGRIFGDAPGYNLSQALTILFSAKESLYKALYPEVRRFMDFSAARINAWVPGLLDLRLVEDWHPAWRAGSTLQVRYALRADCVYTSLHLPR
ncbi:4'-phosphopantetheinyl transferase superfamily protein [Oxalobacteraceae bacterium CAVE-383]|nr:4'-phosphopantetheinyl transferase superfamily protein [Oxalobacteraceae bacterium CAVE-383]